MIFKKKHTLVFLLAFTLFLLPSISALTLVNTTFFASATNYTIFVDSITLDNVTITSTSITFFNLTSVESNFTNTNLTSDAVATFDGLDVGLTIRNVNTSIDLFNSTLGDQNFNVTFSPGIVLRTITTISVTPSCSPSTQSILNLAVLFFALAIVFIPILVLFVKGKLSLTMNTKMFVVVFVGVILGLVFIGAIADSVVSFCG